MEFQCRASFIITIIFVICVCYCDSNPIENIFKKFIEDFEKTYENGTAEYRKRFDIFQMNLVRSKYLNSMRRDNTSAWYGVTNFTDLTPREFREIYLSGFTIPSTYSGYYQPQSGDYSLMNGLNDLPAVGHQLGGDLPQKVDWRKRGIITPVKNQGRCGGCWAFSTVEGLESMYANKTGSLKGFSVQQLIDCSKGFKERLGGCRGGDHCTALYWFYQKNLTLVTDSKYPLKNKDEECKIISPEASGIKVESYKCINATNNEVRMLERLAYHGPIAVAVDAINWHNYLGGIIQHNCPGHVNHAVEIVGYDLTGDVPYYIVRNSWGTKWGIKGYLHLRYNTNACGVARIVSWADSIKIV